MHTVRYTGVERSVGQEAVGRGAVGGGTGGSWRGEGVVGSGRGVGGSGRGVRGSGRGVGEGWGWEGVLGGVLPCRGGRPCFSGLSQRVSKDYLSASDTSSLVKSL